MNLLASKTGLSAPVVFILGSLAVLYGSWVCHSVLTRWEWFRNRFPGMARWGKGWTSFPASRIGVLYGALSGSFFGILLITSASSWRPKLPFDNDYISIGIIFWMITGLLVALRDYYLHLNIKDDDDINE